MNNQKTLCVIPARGGSKGLPGKNIRPLLGKPLIAWTIEAALKSPALDIVIVTTDSQEIADIAKECGAEVPFLRPEELAEDLTTTEDTLQHALLAYEEIAGYQFDICVFMTATCVFRNPAWIAEAVSLLKTRPELESAFTASVTSKNFWQRDSEGKPERLLPWMREYSSRQIRNVIYREDTPIVSASRAWLWREGRRIGDIVEIIEVNDTATDIDIHEEFDFFLAEQALRYRLKTD